MSGRWHGLKRWPCGSLYQIVLGAPTPLCKPYSDSVTARTKARTTVAEYDNAGNATGKTVDFTYLYDKILYNKVNMDDYLDSITYEDFKLMWSATRQELTLRGMEVDSTTGKEFGVLEKKVPEQKLKTSDICKMIYALRMAHRSFDMHNTLYNEVTNGALFNASEYANYSSGNGYNSPWVASSGIPASYQNAQGIQTAYCMVWKPRAVTGWVTFDNDYYEKNGYYVSTLDQHLKGVSTLAGKNMYAVFGNSDLGTDSENVIASDTVRIEADYDLPDGSGNTFSNTEKSSYYETAYTQKISHAKIMKDTMMFLESETAISAFDTGARQKAARTKLLLALDTLKWVSQTCICNCNYCSCFSNEKVCSCNTVLNSTHKGLCYAFAYWIGDGYY